MKKPEDVILKKSQFLQAAVDSLLNQIDATTLHTIVATGRDEFLRIARSQWTGHGFTSEDYREAFRKVQERASQVPLVGGETNAH